MTPSSNHWQSLVENLGAEPPAEAMRPEESESASQEPPAATPRPPAERRPRKQARPAPPRDRKHWASLVEDLGLDASTLIEPEVEAESPDEPPAEETSEQPLSREESVRAEISTVEDEDERPPRADAFSTEEIGLVAPADAPAEQPSRVEKESKPKLPREKAAAMLDDLFGEGLADPPAAQAWEGAKGGEEPRRPVGQPPAAPAGNAEAPEASPRPQRSKPAEKAAKPKRRGFFSSFAAGLFGEGEQPAVSEEIPDEDDDEEVYEASQPSRRPSEEAASLFLDSAEPPRRDPVEASPLVEMFVPPPGSRPEPTRKPRMVDDSSGDELFDEDLHEEDTDPYLRTAEVDFDDEADTDFQPPRDRDERESRDERRPQGRRGRSRGEHRDTRRETPARAPADDADRGARGDEDADPDEMDFVDEPRRPEDGARERSSRDSDDGARKKRSAPSWQEAIGVLVDKNMAAHRRDGGRDSRSGRSRDSRGRGRRRSGGGDRPRSR